MPTIDTPTADKPVPAEPPLPREAQEQHESRKHGHSPLYWLIFALLVAGAAVLVIFVGWLPRHREKQETAKSANERKDALPKVEVVKIRQSPAESELMVPGTTQAYTEANIYARASGYLTKRLVDIGDHVRAGQLLAIVDAPDLDKQVAQAQSNLRQSESNLVQLQAQLHLAALTWDRYKVLVARGVFSRQDGDTQEANYRVSEANVRAAENTIQANRDNVERLIVLQGYERVTAPFAGVVTARNVDVGTLITAQGNGVASSAGTLPGTTQSGAEANNSGSSGNVSSSTTPSTGGSQGGALFTISQTDRFRILVSVPEAYSSVVRTGQRADLIIQELPNEKFVGHVSRSSAAIDQNTRTLLVEVQVFNHKNILLPGMFAEVNLIQSHDVPPLLIPGEAIVVRDGQNKVALVEDQVVHLRPVTIGRDYGDQSEITSGLKPGDVVAVSISDDVREGGKIQPEFAKEKPQVQPGGQSDRKPGTEGQYGNQKQTNGGASGAGAAKGGSGGSGKQGGSGGKQK